MKIAFIVYDGMTLLDFAGAYDPLTRLKTMGVLPDMEYAVCAMKDQVKAFEGVSVVADRVKDDLSEYDYIFIPGGNGIVNLMKDPEFVSWIKNTGENTILTAVCGGSLALGAAGYLGGKNATTHPGLMQFLGRFTEKTSTERIVEDGRLITARGVTSAIDLGLFICEKIAGKEAREKIQKQMDYLNYTVK